MLKKRFFILGLLTLALLIVLILASSRAGQKVAAQAREPVDERAASAPLSVSAIVTNSISYQGMLTEGGNPVNGSRDMTFQLYSNAACTATTGSSIVIPDVLVSDGLFSVALEVSSSSVNGQGLWLGVQVEGAAVGCQEILPAPYALSLRPGARIIGEQTGWDGIHVENTAASGLSYGVYAMSHSTGGRGLFGYASASSGANFGVYGRSDSTGGTGVYARGVDLGADLILGGNANTTAGDDGRITSDPAYASSDIVLLTNDGIRIDLDNDADGEEADFEIRDKDDTLILNVDESGSIQSSALSYLWISGNGLRPYHQTDSTVIDLDSIGGAIVTPGETAVAKYVMLPVTIAGPLYGQNVTISALDIYWVGDTDMDSITDIRFRRQTGVCASCYAEILHDDTDHTCYEDTYTTGCTIHYDLTTNNVLSADSGILYLMLQLTPIGDATWLHIGGARLTLEHN